jgi:peptidoglycan/xylan/chitin deacetylase (PgdA/CDA1 family)
MYHAVVRTPLTVPDWCFLDEASFLRQMRYLRSHCDVIPLSTVPARLRAGDIARPTVAITFDDGFLNNYEVAFPILLAADLPATIFLTTGFIGGDDTLWYCRVNGALARTRHDILRWRNETFDLSSIPAKTETARALNARLKTFPQARLLEEVRALTAMLDVDADWPIERASPFRMLGSSDIRTMKASGLIDFGAHTVSHAILSCLSADAQRREIEESIQAVARLTGEACTLFAYPNGRVEDYDHESICILARSGVETAVTVIEDVSGATASPLELPRLGVGEDADWHDVLARMTNVWGRV